MRWKANIFVRHDFGCVKNEVCFDEIEDLQEIVEGGPDFRAIKKIELFYAWDEGQTVEGLCE